MDTCLGILRLVWFIFFLCFAGIYVWVAIYPAHTGYQYFTYWNVGLAFFYYLLASIASAIGYCFKASDDSVWSPSIVRFGETIRILLSVAGPTALMITILNFGFLNSSGQFANVADHLITSV